MSELDRRLERKVKEMFAPADRDEALRLLSDESKFGIGPLPPRSAKEMTRIRAALLKIANGSLERMRKYVGDDYRDLLVWSGFGGGTASDDWLDPPQTVEPHD